MPTGAEEGYDAYGYNPAGEAATGFATGFEPATGFEAAPAPTGFETAAAPPAPLEYAAAPVQVRPGLCLLWGAAALAGMPQLGLGKGPR